MESRMGHSANQLFKYLGFFMRKCMFKVLSVGPIPNHIAFILDGNRRYAKKHNLTAGAGYRDGFLALLSIIKYCTEVGVKYVTIYAFSIDNFRRKPEEVQLLMDLMLEKIEVLLKEEGFVNKYDAKVCFIGNLELLTEPIRIAADKLMKATAQNTRTVILICVAYTSSNEITNAVQESCKHKQNEREQPDKRSIIQVVDIEKHMYMGVAPDPDILIRTSGEKRLSNFLLWQTNGCLLYSAASLWPEVSLWNLVWAIIEFQRYHSHLEKKKKKHL